MNMNDSPQFLIGLVSWEKINQTRRVSVLNSGQTSFPPRWNKTCTYRACLLSASPFWRSGRSQGGVERGTGRTTLTADASRYIRARGTPVPRRDSATASRNFPRFSTNSPTGNEDRNRALLRQEREKAIDWGSSKGQSIALGPRGP